MYRNFALVIAVFVAGVQASCSKYDVERCMTPITDFRHELGISDQLAYFPLYSLNDQQINDYCRYGRQTAVCLNGLNYCEDVITKLFEGYLDSFDFLCKETMEEYKSHQQCYATHTLVQGLENCNTEASANFKSITAYTYMAKDKFCGYIKEDYRCIRDAVEPMCGKDAADWEVNYVKKVIKPMMGLVNCPRIDVPADIPKAWVAWEEPTTTRKNKVVQASCSKYDVEQCMTPITDFRHKLGISDKLAYFPLYSINDQQINDYCKYGRQAAVCLNGLNYCNTVVKKIFEGFLDSFDFLCKETLEEYKSHKRCYARTTLVQGLEHCNHEASVNFKSITYNTYMAKDKFCGYIKEDYRCIRDVVEPVCGKDAADWEVNYVKKVITPMMSLVNCAAIPRWAIYIIIAISVVIVVMITTVICCVKSAICCVKSGKKMRNTRPALQFNNVLAKAAEAQAPPQYSDTVKEP